MDAKWLTSIGSACMGAWVTYQALFATKISEVAIVLRLVLHVVRAVLLMAVGRPHPKVTN